MNVVMLMGRLTKEPDVRTASNGNTVAYYTLAVDRYNKNGENSADFINCTCFGKIAEFVQKYLHKGMRVIANGTWQTGSYQKDGTTVYTNTCVVFSHEFCESRGTGNASSYAPTQATATATAPNAEGFMHIPDGVEDQGLPFN